jgi:hypothetical protein
MSFAEFLTKISIVCFGVSAVKTGMMSVQTSCVVVAVLMVASFIRDASLRSRQIIRMQPSYGVWFVISYLITMPFMVFIKNITCSDFLKPWETVYAAAVISMGFRAFLIFCEGLTRLICSKIFGFDNRALDAAQQQLNRAWKKKVKEYRNRNTTCNSYAAPACSSCGTEYIPGVGYCVMCYGGSNSVANISHNPSCSLPLMPRRI